MQTASSESQTELGVFVRRQLWNLAGGLLLLVIFAMLVGYWYQDDIRNFAELVAQRFGFGGMLAVVWVSDTLVTPVPPDLFLLIISNSSLEQHWYIYVGLLSVVSMLAGHCGYWLGRKLAKWGRVPRAFTKYSNENFPLVKKFGVWAVIIGAVTPFPFSVTCWSAGMLRMPYYQFSLAAAVRVPRIFVYYFIIASSSELFWPIT